MRPLPLLSINSLVRAFHSALADANEQESWFVAGARLLQNKENAARLSAKKLAKCQRQTIHCSNFCLPLPRLLLVWLQANRGSARLRSLRRHGGFCFDRSEAGGFAREQAICLLRKIAGGRAVAASVPQPTTTTPQLSKNMEAIEWQI